MNLIGSSVFLAVLFFASYGGATTLQDAERAEIERRPADAFAIWMRLAEQGNLEAQLKVSDAYFDGYGTVKNYRSAFLWSYKASQNGYGRAQFRLGSYYLRGIGAEENNGLAYAWLLIGQANGATDMANLVNTAQSRLSSAQIHYYQDQALKCQKQAFKNCYIK